MSEDDVRALLIKQAARLKTKRFGSTGLSQWCLKHGAHNSNVSEFLSGYRGPSSAILNGLGLEYRIVRKRRTA